MDEREQTVNEVLFVGLVINLHSTAMVALGKIVNPISQKIERDLDQARFTIDMLSMLEHKTKGNLSDGEAQTLKRTLTELRMNYVDEAEKDKKESQKESGKKSDKASEKESQGESDEKA
ncbi:MAG: DUF1844 domain-containing protein [Candidatus Eisenbacteria bacterium]